MCRRTDQEPHGDVSNQKVKEANNMAYLVSALFRFAAAKGIQVFLEQPKGSYFVKFKNMAMALRLTQCQKVNTFLGAYSDELGIQKPLQIWSNTTWGKHLVRSAPQKMVEESKKYYVRTINTYTGVSGPDGLQSSGAYPREFGEAVIHYYRRYGLNVQPIQEECIQMFVNMLLHKDCVHFSDSIHSHVFCSITAIPCSQDIDPRDDSEDDNPMRQVYLQGFNSSTI